MGLAYKVLGQVNPVATTLTKLYTVPAATKTVVSFLSIANEDAGASAYRIQIRKAGAATDVKQYIRYDENLNMGQSQEVARGLSLEATDEIWVYASTANVAFGAHGVELTL